MKGRGECGFFSPLFVWWVEGTGRGSREGSYLRVWVGDITVRGFLLNTITIL